MFTSMCACTRACACVFVAFQAVCPCAHAYAGMFACVRGVCVCVCPCVHVLVHICVRACAYAYVCVHVCVRMWVCLRVPVHVCACVRTRPLESRTSCACVHACVTFRAIPRHQFGSTCLVHPRARSSAATFAPRVMPRHRFRRLPPSASAHAWHHLRHDTSSIQCPPQWMPYVAVSHRSVLHRRAASNPRASFAPCHIIHSILCSHHRNSASRYSRHATSSIQYSAPIIVLVHHGIRAMPRPPFDALRLPARSRFR